MDEKQFLALPKDQREEFQRQLKGLNLYHSKIDGKSGDGMRTALRAFADKQKREAEVKEAGEAQKRQDEIAAKNADTERLKAEAASKTANVDAEAKSADVARQKRYDEQASSGMGMATQSAANLVAPTLAGALGMKVGGKLNDKMDAAQEKRNVVLRGTAADRMSGVTNREAAVEGATRAGAMPKGSTLGRVMSRMAPHLGLGLVAGGKGAQILHDADPNGEFYPYQADRAAGLGMIGFGTGLAKQGISYAASPGVPPDARALAVINAPQLRRGGAGGALAAALEAGNGSPAPMQPQGALAAPEAPVASTEPPQRQRRVSLAQAAKEAGATGKMNKAAAAEYLDKNLNDANRGKIAKALGVTNGPNLESRLRTAISDMASKRGLSSFMGGVGPAAGIAAGIAAAATPGEAMAADGTTRGGMGEAATNAAVAGGVGAGVSKLAQALGPVAGMMGEASAPGMIDAMTDDFGSAEARNWAARNFPEAMQFGAVDQARQMATVPQANPARVSGEGGYGTGIKNRIRRMQATGATPDQIAAFLNGAIQ